MRNRTERHRSRFVALGPIVLLAIALLVMGCSSGQGSTPSKPATEPKAETAAQEPAAGAGAEASPAQPAAVDFQTEAKKLQVECKVDEAMVDSRGRHKVTVTVFNNSAYDFEGHVWVRSKDVSGETLGSDALLFTGSDRLPSGKGRWANVWLKTWPGGRIEYEISGKFVSPAHAAPAGAEEIDEEATAKIKRMLNDNFRDTSWYRLIKDVAAYKNGTAVVTVEPGFPVARGIGANIVTAGLGMDSVLVKTTDGEELCRVTK